LGVATFQVQFAIAHELLDAGVSLILEGNFLTAEWFEALPAAEILQVHVSAAPETLRQRLLVRDTHRHPVHYDREAANEIAKRATSGEWGPLPIGGTVVRIDTTTWPNLGEVLATI
jgi:predicted kinase